MSVAGLISSWPRLRLQVAWNVGGLQTGTPYWTDLTARIQGSWTATQSGRQYELDTVSSGTGGFTLDGNTGLFDSTNTAGPYYGSIRPYRKAQVLATWPPTQNLLPQALASGSSAAATQVTGGTDAVTTGLAAAPSGQTSAITWTFPAGGTFRGIGSGATNASFATCDSDAVPVVSLTGPAVGQTWSFSVYLSRSGGTAGLTLQARINWYQQDGTRISTSDGAATTVPAQTSWVQATVSATAPAGAVWARVEVLNSAVTAVSNTVYLTGWQLEIAPAPTTWADPGVTAPLWTGYLERTKQKWLGAQSLVDFSFVDALAGLARMTLQPSFQATMLALGPSRLYPMDETAGATLFRDLTSKHPALTIGASNLGAGVVTAGNAITGTGGVGMPGPVVTLVNPASTGASQYGSFLALPTPNGPPSTGGWARIIAFRTSSAPPAGQVSALWWWGGAVGTPSQGGLYIDSSQVVYGQSVNSAGQSLLTATAPAPVCDGNWHIVQLVLFPDGKTLAINVDGTASNYSLGSNDCHSTGITTDTIGMNANPINKSYVWPYSGDVAYAMELPTHLVPTFPDIATGFETGWIGEPSATRAQRILNLTGYAGPFTSLGTATAMGGFNVAGTNAVAALNEVGDSEGGQVYVDGGGTVTLAGRKWRYLHYTPDATLGENVAGGEIPYLGGVEVDLDPDHIYNTVTVTNQNASGTQPPTQTATNPVSQQEYFASSLARTINVQNPNEAASATSYLASQYAEPQPRISTVTIDPSATPSLWPVLLTLGFGSRVRLMRRPNNAPAQTVETFVEQLAWKGDDTGKLQLVLQLSAATPYLGWWIVSSLHTTVHTACAIGTSTITLDALTGSALNPAAAVLPVGTVLTLSYGDPFHQENVTVQSVAATSPGYSTVAITLTAPTAHSHAALDMVCQPLPGGFTLPASAAAGFPASLDPNATLSATSPRVTY